MLRTNTALLVFEGRERRDVLGLDRTHWPVFVLLGLCWTVNRKLKCKLLTVNHKKNFIQKEVYAVIGTAYRVLKELLLVQLGG